MEAEAPLDVQVEFYLMTLALAARQQLSEPGIALELLGGPEGAAGGEAEAEAGQRAKAGVGTMEGADLEMGPRIGVTGANTEAEAHLLPLQSGHTVADKSACAANEANVQSAARPKFEHLPASSSRQAVPPNDTQVRGPKLTYDKQEGVFMECFPDPCAGAPINNTIASRPDLDAYMAVSGNLGNPWHFDTAELLVTTGLMAAGRDEHLKSHIYVGQTPWKNNKMMMANIDKLPHGPGWKIYEIKDKEGPHKSSYLFTRDIIEVIKEIMANLAFRKYM
ncbi:hypothetical protein FRC07_014604 [Ceratobasidium sp. 392]|nr:hypothetical protein FRC07_014604 [Ceratobasidium sp. 392]